MKLHVPVPASSPYNDGSTMTGLQLYRLWLRLAQQVSVDPGIPEDKRLHAMIFLEGMQMVARKQKRDARAQRRRKPARAVGTSLSSPGLARLVWLVSRNRAAI